MPSQLAVDQVSIHYDATPVVQQVSFRLEAGEIGCLLGPSGCGKTSLLRAVAGFEPISAGQIRLHGWSVSRPGQRIEPEQRRVGMVFQDFALFPHLNVAQNVAFGLRGEPRKAQRERIEQLLSLVGLASQRHAFPHQLSGGQQQRVALIRALAPRPELLLLDEPFSSMDSDLREQLAHEVRNILNHEGITALLVTHDQQEAFAIADRIGVLGERRLHQWDTGYRLYHQPADRFVADFIGQGVFLPGTLDADGRVQTELGHIGPLTTPAFSAGTQVQVLLRPDDVLHDDASPLRLPVQARSFRGAEYLYTLGLPSGRSVLCLVQSHHDHHCGEQIGIRLDVAHLALFPMDSRQT